MALNDYIDSIIRKSLIGKYLSGFRSSNPVAYKRFRSYYERVMKFHSKDGLARYQVNAVKHFSQMVPLNILNNSVLEVGSDLDARVIIALKNAGCREVIGINPEFEEEKLIDINSRLPSGCILKKGDLRSTKLPDEAIGAIFSVSVFEHLLDFDHCLSEMYRLLVPGGYVYAEFGPIWSSSLGHHVFANTQDEEARHWDPTKNPVPNYGHLLMDRSTMVNYLKERVSDSLASEIVNWIYDTSYINRLFFEDYIRLIENSNFEVIKMEFDREYIPKDMINKLQSTFPNYKSFDVRNIQLVLRKSI